MLTYSCLPIVYICCKLQGLIVNCPVTSIVRCPTEISNMDKTDILMFFLKTCSLYGLLQVRKRKYHPVNFQVKNPEATLTPLSVSNTTFNLSGNLIGQPFKVYPDFDLSPHCHDCYYSSSHYPLSFGFLQ